MLVSIARILTGAPHSNYAEFPKVGSGFKG